MSRNCFLLQLFLILQIFSFVYSNGLYTINAPGTIKSNRKYTVCVSLHNVSKSVTMRVGINHQLSWNAFQDVTLQPFETKMLDFYPPKLDANKLYALSVIGLEGLYFQNRTEIPAVADAGANIYIETDKGTYKPGDLLRFRVIVLDEHTRPMNIIEPIKVQIFDEAGNRVKQFKDIRLNKGFYADEFQISKEPILGRWLIKVFIGGKYALEQITSFNVEKYVLPKFKVHIKADPIFVIEDRLMKIDVFGKYTYNKFVEGNVELEIGMRLNRGLFQWKYLTNITADIVEFKANIEFDLYSLLDNRAREDGGTLHVRANLMEKGTRIVQRATTEIELKTQKYKITMPYDEVQFRKRIPYSMRVKVQHWNDTIVNDPLALVSMQHGRNKYESKLDTNGTAYFEFVFSPYYNFEFQYKDSSAMQYNLFNTVDDDVSDTKSTSANCRLSLKRKRPDLNSILEVIVESNREIPYLIYMVTSHANIIKSERVQLGSKQNIYTIKITPSIEMVPVSFIYVHYIVNGDLIFCEKKIELQEEFENKLSISAPQNVKPGEGITMKINAQPDSKVLIAAVDLSSVLLNSDNRFNKQNILNNLIMDKCYSRGFFIGYPGQLSGLITLTDADYELFYPEVTQHTERNWAHQEIYIDEGSWTGFDREPDVRSKFPETWIFKDFEATDAVSTIDFKLPDTITTWIVTAYSLNEKSGVGIIDPALEITAFKKFFISTYLPYSIKLGEIVSIPTMIFNYHSESLSTEVEMKNSLKEFKFVDENSNMTTNLGIVKRNIIVPANSAKAVNFLIYPQKLGDIDIHLTAKNKLFADGILQKLPVEPDGETIFNNHDLYLTLTPEENSTAYFKANIPLNVIPECTYLQLSISGNVLLPSLENLDDLVDKPTGCGEQNMIHFAPDILVLEYLSATDQTLKYANLVATAIKYVEIGYQQQLRFRHENGGYSVFSSSRPSNWLTAYVIRFFIKGIKYLHIESHIIESGLDFLSTQQSSNGEFINAGYLFHPAHQNRYGFTAFVLLSFMESRKYARKYKGVIQKGLDFLASNSNDVDDIYSLAIMATAFTMAKHEHAPVILNKLLPLAKNENGMQWWTDNTNGRTTDIESTSYILLALLHKPGHYLPIAKWLLEQRNNHGGFKSTQDTVVGLQAMIKFAQSSKAPNDTLIKVSYRALDTQKDETENGIMGLDPENLMILQRQELPSLTRSVEIFVLGTGNVFLQFSYQYNQNENLVQSTRFSISENIKALPKSFIINTAIESALDDPTLTMDVCFKYQPLDEAKNAETNMVIVEINLPSGYIMSSENLKELESVDVVERVEYKKLNEVILYFAFLEPNKEVCVNVVVDKKNDVRNLKPSMIVIYDYYYSDRREVATYEIANN